MILLIIMSAANSGLDGASCLRLNEAFPRALDLGSNAGPMIRRGGVGLVPGKVGENGGRAMQSLAFKGILGSWDR